MDLPPGFRFHPTDEELITHYLSKKVLDISFTCIAIGEVDMNSVEPWDLPWMAKLGEKEWYFFCVRDKKYPTGLRTNRATMSGYWKATGKDKEIFRRRALVGMKKTLVFYRGRAPKGVRTNWVCHEYRLEGKSLEDLHKLSKNDWAISRVFQKTSGGKKVHISRLMRMGSPPGKGPLMGPPPSHHVHCFSNDVPAEKLHDSETMFVSSPGLCSPWAAQQLNPSSAEGFHYSQFPGSVSLQDDRLAVKKNIFGGHKNGGLRAEDSSLASMGKKALFEEDEAANVLGTHDFDGLWNY